MNRTAARLFWRCRAPSNRLDTAPVGDRAVKPGEQFATLDESLPDERIASDRCDGRRQTAEHTLVTLHTVGNFRWLSWSWQRCPLHINLAPVEAVELRLQAHSSTIAMSFVLADSDRR
jgi:hypothetical protein